MNTKSTRGRSGTCVHCLQFFDRLTDDHLFPKSWYPDSTPENTEKWTFPACDACNKEHGKNEDQLLTALGLCIDPDISAGSGIAQKAYRSIDPSAGRDEADAKLRAARQEKLTGFMRFGAEIPLQGRYPGFDVPDIDRDQAALLIPASSIEKLFQKIVRGIAFLIDGRLIRAPFYMESFAIQNIRAHELDSELDKFGTAFGRGHELVVTRMIAPEDGLSGLYRLEIWGRLKSYVFVMDRGREANSTQ